jgi:choline dehydrogenase
MKEKDLVAEKYDYVVVGGGAAGCIVAARLSEKEDRSVLLLEAGEDYAAGTTPEGVLDARYVPMRGHAPTFNPDHDWGLVAHSRGGAGISVPQGKLIGGGAAINGGIALRGALADYDEWVAFGNPRWSWDQVLPFFKKIETDAAPGDDIHGRSGPVPINRATEEELAPLQEAFIESAVAAGAPYVWDLNAPNAHGVGPVPQTRIGGRRVSTAEAYLEPARTRSNLTIRGKSLVARVLFDGNRAVGVELADGTVIRADEVVVSAGAILSPAILQRSGVGPADLVASLATELVADLPVGKNLGDHFSIPLMAVPNPGVWEENQFSLQAAYRMSTKAQPNSLDGQLTMFTYLNARTTGEGARGIAGEGNGDIENVAGIGCVLNKPRSVGTVRASTMDPAVLPDVDPNYLDARVDREAIREIVRVAWDVLTAPPLADMLGAPMGMDAETIADDAALDAAIEEKTASGYHFTGTCLMAPVDRGGVVDEEGRVHGIEGLRVIDASIVPTTPAANSMLTTYMVAERISSMMVEESAQVDELTAVKR